MATITMPGMLLTGTHSARPAASAVGKGTLYNCTDHKLTYQTTDGANWTNWDVQAAGFAPFAAPDGVSGYMEFNVASIALAAVSGGNAGAVGMWIPVNAPMKLESYAIWNQSTASARTAEARLYVDSLNASTSLTFVTGTDATFSFTPSAADRRVSGSVSGAPVYLAPGRYFLVIRNTSATQTFQIGRTTAATNILFKSQGANLSTASIAALGATFDFTTLTKGDGIYGMMLLGRVGGQAAAW